jgi:hypothetical protein
MTNAIHHKTILKTTPLQILNSISMNNSLKQKQRNQSLKPNQGFKCKNRT